MITFYWTVIYVVILVIGIVMYSRYWNSNELLKNMGAALIGFPIGMFLFDAMQ